MAVTRHKARREPAARCVQPRGPRLGAARAAVTLLVSTIRAVLASIRDRAVFVCAELFWTRVDADQHESVANGRFRNESGATPFVVASRARRMTAGTSR